MLVDVDPQSSATQWGDLRGQHYPLVTPTHATRLVRTQDAAQSGGASRLIVDTPARMAETALAAARIADVLIIPCTPSGQDLGAIASTIELARLAHNPRSSC